MNSNNIKHSRALINRLAYLKRTNKDEYIKYKKKLDDDKMNSLMNNIETNNDNNNKTFHIPNNKTDNIPNNKTDNIPNNKTDNIQNNKPFHIPTDETSYYLNYYNQPNIKNLNNIKLLLNNLLDDNEYIKVLEVLILNKDVFETNKYNHNLKMVLIGGYKEIIDELNETIDET
jgi:hypothetical protein